MINEVSEMEISVQIYNSVDFFFPVKVHVNWPAARGSTHTHILKWGPSSRLSLTSMFDFSFRIQSGWSLKRENRAEKEEEEVRAQRATGTNLICYTVYVYACIWAVFRDSGRCSMLDVAVYCQDQDSSLERDVEKFASACVWLCLEPIWFVFFMPLRACEERLWLELTIYERGWKGRLKWLKGR